jgi:hypothetical protein
MVSYTLYLLMGIFGNFNIGMDNEKKIGVTINRRTSTKGDITMAILVECLECKKRNR